MSGDARGERVAVVIVNANAGELLDCTLAALARQTLRPQRILVVDNASSDGSTDGIEERYPGVEVLRLGENVGFAAGNNIAVRAASDCEWIALLNPDAFPEPRWLETLIGIARQRKDYSFFASRLVKVAPPGELDGTGDVYHVSGMAWRRDHGRVAVDGTLASEEVFSPCAAAALYRREAFLGVGGFDESFFCYFEDSDLAFRLRLAGHRCLYVPDAVVHHVGSATTGGKSEFTVYHSCRNLVWTYVKNMPSPLFWAYLPQHLLVNVLNVVWFSITGQARAVLTAKRDAVRALPLVLRERRAIQATRSVDAFDLRRHMAKGIAAYTTSFKRAVDTFRKAEPGL